MASVITKPCQECKDLSCVTVCPVDCIQEGTFTEGDTTYNQLFVDPEACICCGLCVPECPVEAIFEEDEVPAQWSRYVQVNADFHHQRGG